MLPWTPVREDPDWTSAAAAARVEEELQVWLARWCSRRHMMPFHSLDEGSTGLDDVIRIQSRVPSIPIIFYRFEFYIEYPALMTWALFPCPWPRGAVAADLAAYECVLRNHSTGRHVNC